MVGMVPGEEEVADLDTGILDEGDTLGEGGRLVAQGVGMDGDVGAISLVFALVVLVGLGDGKIEGTIVHLPVHAEGGIAVGDEVHGRGHGRPCLSFLGVWRARTRTQRRLCILR